SSQDAAALQTYRDAMPGYEVLGYTGTWYDNDAIHCRAMGVPDEEMLFVHHIPLVGNHTAGSNYPVSAHIAACSQTELISDSLKVYYRVDGAELEYVMLSSTSSPDSFYCEIPEQSSGSEITYYIKAADGSGRVETHPFIGEAWAHSFRVNTAPLITSVDSIVWQAESYFAFAPEYFDPDDSVLTITYSDHPAWLAASGDSLRGTAPKDRLLTGFTVSVSDECCSDSLAVTLFVYICGDVNASGDGPDISDLTYMVSYLFTNGDDPPDEIAADVNGSSNIDISDVTALVSYLFVNGPALTCR
ncbi:MAG: dockerin type I repeat-containing protein, partial [candidate division Zixibacteria bacterium]